MADATPTAQVGNGPAVAKLISDAKAAVNADLAAGKDFVDKVFDSAVAGEQLVLQDGEAAALETVVAHVPPAKRAGVEAFVAILASPFEAQANPILNAEVAKGLVAAKAWIDAHIAAL